jgi:hypothetical protein
VIEEEDNSDDYERSSASSSPQKSKHSIKPSTAASSPNKEPRQSVMNLKLKKAMIAKNLKNGIRPSVAGLDLGGLSVNKF